MREIREIFHLDIQGKSPSRRIKNESLKHLWQRRKPIYPKKRTRWWPGAWGEKTEKRPVTKAQSSPAAKPYL